jgi:hypothetical protein
MRPALSTELSWNLQDMLSGKIEHTTERMRTYTVGMCSYQYPPPNSLLSYQN